MINEALEATLLGRIGGVSVRDAVVCARERVVIGAGVCTGGRDWRTRGGGKTEGGVHVLNEC